MADKPAPTAAEEELAQRDVQQQDTLKEDAREQKKQQRQELRASKKAAKVERGDTPSAMHRSDHVQNNTAASPERPDQYTIRNPHEEVAYGAFCTYTGPEMQSAGSTLETGDYGVLLDTKAGSEDGETVKQVTFRRRADLATFPVNYDDLKPSESRGNAPR